MKIVLWSVFIVLCFISACGKKPSEFAARNVDRLECPISFEKNNLCAKIDWKTGPTADGESSFELNFWKKDNSEVGKELSQGLAVFLRMTCCGTVKVPKMTAVSTDRFLINQIQFVPGNWEIHLQIKGPLAEQAVVQVSLDDQ